MSMIIAIMWLPARIALALWAWTWVWTYPLSRPSITEMRTSSQPDKVSLKIVIDALYFALELPLMARAQHYAERSALTRTAVSTDTADAQSEVARSNRWLSEPAWRSKLRESMVWSTLTSWLIAWGSVGASFVFTGNFLFESHATPDSPGYVTPYFMVAAMALSLQMTWIGAGLALLGITRRAS